MLLRTEMSVPRRSCSVAFASSPTFAEQMANPGFDPGERGAFDYGWPRDVTPSEDLEAAVPACQAGLA